MCANELWEDAKKRGAHKMLRVLSGGHVNSSFEKFNAPGLFETSI